MLGSRPFFFFRFFVKNNARFVSFPVCAYLLLILLVLPLRAEETDQQEVEEEDAPDQYAGLIKALTHPDVARQLAAALAPMLQASTTPTRGRGRPPKLLSAGSLSTTEDSADRLTPVSSPANAADLAACRMAVKDLMETATVSVLLFECNIA